MRWNREGDNDLNWSNYISVDNYFRNPPYSSDNGLWLTNWCDVLFRTDSGKKFILVVEYNGLSKVLEYTVPAPTYNYHVIKYRGQTQSDATASKCNNYSESRVGINIENSSLTVGKIYKIDRGTGIGYRWYEVTSKQSGSNSSADTNISSSNVSSGYYADCTNTGGDPGDGTEIDLEIQSVKVYKNGNSYYNTSTSTGDLSLHNGSYYDFEVTIKNNGDLSTNGGVGLSIEFCQCSGGSYPNVTRYSVNATTNTGQSIPASGTSVYKFENIYVSEHIGTSPMLYEGQSAYKLFFHVNESGNVNETNYDNNYDFIDFQYFNPNRTPLPLKPKTLKSSLSSSQYENSTYDMEIYNFSGSKIKQSQNLTGEEKEQIISELPKGYYIIKTQETKTTKIKKN